MEHVREASGHHKAPGTTEEPLKEVRNSLESPRIKAQHDGTDMGGGGWVESMEKWSHGPKESVFFWGEAPMGAACSSYL